MCMSLLMRINRGIIRHTGISDMVRISALNAACSVIYCWAGITFVPDGVRMFPLSVVLINFFICTSFMLFYRLLVKWLFRHYRNYRSSGYVRAAIYNAGYPGVMVHEAVSNEQCFGIRVVAFLETRAAHNGKFLKGLPVYAGPNGLQELVKQERISLLIIAEELQDKEQMRTIVEQCMACGVKVQQVQSAEEWIKGEPCGVTLKDMDLEEIMERPVIHIHNDKLLHELQGRCILVTGAAGSIGSGIVRQLTAYEPAVIVMCDNAESPLHELELEMQELAPQLTTVPFIANVCDRARMQQLFEIYVPDIVYHAAAYKHVPMMEKHPSIAVVNNVQGTRVMAELAVEYQVRKFVLVSTDKAVNPANIMGASKRIAEIYVQSYNNYLDGLRGVQQPVSGRQHTLFITTRFGNVLGSNGSVVPRFRRQLEKGGPLTVTHPEMTRYFMAIPEACQLLLEAGVMGQGGEIFVFDMGKPVKIADLARKMIQLAGKQPGKEISIVYTGLRPGEKLYEELLNNAENTLPTYNDKIMIARARRYDFEMVCDRIDELLHYAERHDTLKTVALMKELVPEFVSKNSVYAALDKGQVALNES